MKVFLIFSSLFCLISISAISQLKQIKINGAELNYVDTGKGQPIVFIHGGLEDYTTWIPQLEKFSGQYRVIAYSRRYNYPNQNTSSDTSFSPIKEAADLASLMALLNLDRAHVVGHSYGGLIAMMLAVQHPKLVRTLTLSEPATINWLPNVSGGQVLQNEFKEFWKAVKGAFQRNDSIGVLRQTFMYFAGGDMLDKLPEEAIDQLKANLGEWKAISFSPDAFSGAERSSVKKIKMPVLILTAGNTLPLLQPLNKELVRLLPQATHFHLAQGTHDFWMTHPQEIGQQVFAFVTKN